MHTFSSIHTCRGVKCTRGIQYTRNPPKYLLVDAGCTGNPWSPVFVNSHMPWCEQKNKCLFIDMHTSSSIHTCQVCQLTAEISSGLFDAMAWSLSSSLTSAPAAFKATIISTFLYRMAFESALVFPSKAFTTLTFAPACIKDIIILIKKS